MRYLIKYSKGEKVKFLGHLDLMRTIQRIIRRSEINISYSNGFNPHIQMSIAQPLSVGVISECEYIDIYLDDEINKELLVEKLNNASVPDIKFSNAQKIIQIPNEKKIPTAMALVSGAEYSIHMYYETLINFKEELEKIEELDEYIIIKKSKSGEKEVDIKPLIIDFKYKIINEEEVNIKLICKCGSKDNLSSDLFAKFISKNTSNIDAHRSVNIYRNKLYTLQDKKFVEIDKYVENISI